MGITGILLFRKYFLVWMYMPCSKAAILAQAGRMLAKKLGLTPANSILLKVSKIFSTNSLFIYLAIIALHEMTSLWGILSNSTHALSVVPHFAYMSTRAFPSGQKSTFHIALMDLDTLFQISHFIGSREDASCWSVISSSCKKTLPPCNHRQFYRSSQPPLNSCTMHRPCSVLDY